MATESGLYECVEHYETSLSVDALVEEGIADSSLLTYVDNDESINQFSGCFGRRKKVPIFSHFEAAKLPVAANWKVHVSHHDKTDTMVTATSHPMHHRRVFSTGDLPNTFDAGTCTISEDADKQCLATNNQLASIVNAEATITKQCHDTDEDSVGSTNSTNYFDAADFDSVTWKRVLNNASTVGLVVVALATAVTHPIWFLAVTLIGTATAASPYCNWSQKKSSEQDDDITATDKWNETEDQLLIEKQNSDPMCIDWFCFQPAPVSLEDGEKNDDRPLVITTANNDEDDATAECSGDESAEECNDEATKHHVPHQQTFLESAQIVPLTVNATSSKTKALAPMDQKAWLLRHFPPLKNVAMEKGGPLVGLNAVDFFHVFFDDDAPYGFRAFQEKRGDLDIKYGSWEPLPTVGPISLFSPWHGAFEFPQDVKYRFFQGRRLNFKAKTNSFFGPPYATTIKMQRFLIINKRLAVLENKTMLYDIPYSDRFFVMERWFITAEKINDRYVTHVSITCEASFTQSCPFEVQIKSKSTSTISDIVASWCAMAKEAIKLTEMAKLDRLRRRQLDFDDESETDHPELKIVTYSGATHDGVEVVADASFRAGSEEDYAAMCNNNSSNSNVLISSPSQQAQVSTTTKELETTPLSHYRSISTQPTWRRLRPLRRRSMDDIGIHNVVQ